MRKLFICWFLVCFLSLPTLSVEVADYLQDISVTIKSGYGEGSGVIFTRENAKGNKVNLIWTAAHVVDDLRSTRKVIVSDGSERIVVEFKDAKVIKEIIENGRRVGKLELDAEVLKYSKTEDLALLRLRKKDFVDSSVKFYLKNKIPSLGTRLYHVGSLLGQTGANSMTDGIYSQKGRLIGKQIFDQSTVVAFPGSSGGGLFLEDGQYVGMIVRGAGETFNLFVPIRRMVEWADYINLMWALDPDIPMPAEPELRKMPVEDTGKSFEFKRDKSENKKLEFIIGDEIAGPGIKL